MAMKAMTKRKSGFTGFVPLQCDREFTAPQWKKYSCAEEFLLLRTPVNSRPDRQETNC